MIVDDGTSAPFSPRDSPLTIFGGRDVTRTFPETGGIVPRMSKKGHL